MKRIRGTSVLLFVFTQRNWLEKSRDDLLFNAIDRILVFKIYLGLHILMSLFQGNFGILSLRFFIGFELSADIISNNCIHRSSFVILSCRRLDSSVIDD